jgi:Zn-dependent alcohol dehydrogenase
MKTKGALLWEPGTNSGWSVEDIEIDPPKRREIIVELAASGICHSDHHFDDGTKRGWSVFINQLSELPVAVQHRQARA